MRTTLKTFKKSVIDADRATKAKLVQKVTTILCAFCAGYFSIDTLQRMTGRGHLLLHYNIRTNISLKLDINSPLNLIIIGTRYIVEC